MVPGAPLFLEHKKFPSLSCGFCFHLLRFLFPQNWLQSGLQPSLFPAVSPQTNLQGIPNIYFLFWGHLPCSSTSVHAKSLKTIYLRTQLLLLIRQILNFSVHHNHLEKLLTHSIDSFTRISDLVGLG
jgi:hypothetical protein